MTQMSADESFSRQGPPDFYVPERGAEKALPPVPCVLGARYVAALYRSPSQATLDALGTHLDHCAVCQATMRTAQGVADQWYEKNDLGTWSPSQPSLAGTLKSFWQKQNSVTLARSK